MITVDALLDRYPPGYIEIMGSISVQLVYFIFGLLMERLRPAYTSSTTRKMIMQSLRNHIVASGIHVLYVFFRGGESVLMDTFTRPYHPPSLAELAGHLVAGVLMRDVGGVLGYS